MIEASAGVISAGEPIAEDPMTEREMAAIDEDKLQDLGTSLATQRDKWVTAKKASQVEKRWTEDADQYHGRDPSTKMAASMMESAEAGYPVTNKDAKPQRSTLFVNITRPKTNAVEARLANMLFPSDDRNWGIKPSPMPELVKQATDIAVPAAAPQGMAPPPGAPVPPMQAGGPVPPGMPPMPGAPPAAMPPAPPSPKDLAAAKLEEATVKALAMQNEIEDQLSECQYNGEGRKLIHDVCALGTGIMKGPIVVNRVSKAWAPMKDSNDPSVFALEIASKLCPASESVSPWNVITDPGCSNDPHTGQGIYEYRNLTSKQLRDLTKQPGYLKDKISEVLEEGPEDSPYMTEQDTRNKQEAGASARDEDHFQLWEYWGQFSPDDLRACGVDVADGSTEVVSGCVIFVNKKVIKGFLNPAETGDLPYDFMQYEKVDGSVWGYGVPFLMRSSQRALNAAWRQLMDNNGLSVGPQIFIKRKGVEPADKRWEITGRKVWLLDDDVNARDAFGFIDIPNHGQEIQQVIDLAMKFADEEASIPAIAQGEKGDAPDTVGGITILMNASNVVLGKLVKQFDDCITRPHLRRYYDWNMAYSENAHIKGDFQVDARGSSALLVRDMQAQSLIQLGQYQASPILGPMVNWEAWFKEVLKLQHIDPSDIMKTEAEIAQLATAQAPPPIQLQVEQVKGQNAMQLAQAKAQAEMQQIQIQAQQEQQQLLNGHATPHMASAQAAIAREQIRAHSSELVEASRAHAEASRADKEIMIAQQNGQYDIQKLQLQREIALLDYANKEKISLNDAKAMLAKSAMDNQTKRELAAAEIQLAQTEGAHSRALDIHKHNTSLVRDEMSTPNTP